jgi:hypothetical protein
VEGLRETWGHVIANDPYYNPNLTRATLTCDLRPL